VSYATSAPELAVSVSASLQGQSPLVVGNVLGSNVANIALILGLVALIAPPKSDGSMAGKELAILFLATLAVPVFLINGTLDRWEGVLLVLGSMVFTWLTIRWSKKRPPDLDEVPTEESRTMGKLILIGTLGLGVLIGGGELFVRGGVGMAEVLGVDQRIIGLTVVAFGTSVPELAASVVAALRGHSDLALGNVVGSNIFNILLILGTAGILDPFHLEMSEMVIDLAFFGGLTLFLCAILWRARKVTRLEGVLLTSAYLAFLGLVVAQ